MLYFRRFPEIAGDCRSAVPVDISLYQYHRHHIIIIVLPRFRRPTIIVTIHYITFASSIIINIATFCMQQP
jgi:hypothetical protein